MASLFIGHAAQKSKLHNLQYDEGGNHMAETETEISFTYIRKDYDRPYPDKYTMVKYLSNFLPQQEMITDIFRFSVISRLLHVHDFSLNFQNEYINDGYH